MGCGLGYLRWAVNLSKMDSEDVLAGFAPEDMLKSFAPEEIEACLKKLKKKLR